MRVQRLGRIAVLSVMVFSLSCGGNGSSSGGPPPPPATYTIGGTVSGLSGTLTLQNNGADNLSLQCKRELLLH